MPRRPGSRLLTVAILAVGCATLAAVPGPSPADEPKAAALSPRAIFYKDLTINPLPAPVSAGKVPTALVLRASVKLIGAGGGYAEVPPTREFRSGERIRLAFAANSAGFFYLATIGSSGRVQVLEPRRGHETPVLLPGQTYEFPPAPRLLEFDDRPGTEEMYVFLSEVPLDVLDFGEGRRERVGPGGSVAAVTARDMSVVAIEQDREATYKAADPGRSHIVQKMVLTHR